MTALPIFFALRKVDLTKRTVEGIATAELVDKFGEICDYDTTKPLYQKWSEGFKKSTGGKSLGNLRAMHSNIAAGKLTDIFFDDTKKSIHITAKVVDDDCWNKVVEGVFTGFSQGGEYVNKWQDGENVRYTAEPSEVSLVDNPCLGEATFEVIKADGATELRKFNVKSDPKADEKPTDKSADPAIEQGWRAKDGSFHKTKVGAIKHNQMVEAEEIAKAAAAGVTKLIGDINDKLDEDLYWKREFSNEERAKAAEEGQAMPDGSFPIKSEEDLKNAIRAVGRAKDPAKTKQHIISRAKAMGLESLIPDEWKVRKAARKVLKGLYDVGRAACLISELEWMHDSLEVEAAVEGDDSPAPDHLSDIIKELCDFITALVQEECGEIVEDHGGTGIEDALEAAVKLPSRHARAVSKYLKAGKLADVVKKAGEAVEPEVKEVHADRVHAIHKCAGAVMQHCMKAMHEMHMDGEEEEDKSAEKMRKSIEDASDHLKKAHKNGHEILQHCMKMGSKIEPGDDGEEEAHKLMKMQAVNTALSKTINDLSAQLTGLFKRIDHLEKQPTVRKGALFVVNPGHEAQPGTAPVETAPVHSYDALRLSPEEQRRISFGK